MNLRYIRLDHYKSMLNGLIQTEAQTSKPSVLTLSQIERSAIVERLAVFSNHKTATAKSLGISLKGLYNKMHFYGIPLK